MPDVTTGTNDHDSGVLLGHDLQRIRSKQGVSLAEVYQSTRISPHVLEELEEDVLNHPLFNKAYLRPLLKQMAEILELDVDTVMEAYDQALEGAYTNQLAVAYLGEEPVEAPRPLEEDTSCKKETVPVEQSVAKQESVVEEEDPREVVVEEAALTRTGMRWPAAAMVMLVALVLTGIGFLMVEQEGGDAIKANVVESEPYQAPEFVPMEREGPPVDTASSQELTMGDSIQVDIVAAHDRVDPIRVRVDDDLRRPYWIEESDSMRFMVSERIIIEDRLDRVRLLVEGFEYPFDVAVPEGPVTITWEDARVFLEEQVSAELLGEMRTEG